jgi:hypothetical protein
VTLCDLGTNIVKSNENWPLLFKNDVTGSFLSLERNGRNILSLLKESH